LSVASEFADFDIENLEKLPTTNAFMGAIHMI
jgi:hypothetical protein